MSQPETRPGGGGREGPGPEPGFTSRGAYLPPDMRKAPAPVSYAPGPAVHIINPLAALFEGMPRWAAITVNISIQVAAEEKP